MTINGVFDIHSKTYSTLCYVSQDITNTNINMNGTASIVAGDQVEIFSTGYSANIINSNINANGDYIASSTGNVSPVYGFNFNSTLINSSVNINGLFTLSSDGQVFGVRLNNIDSTRININGTFALFSSSTSSGNFVRAVQINGGNASSTVIINGTFAIESSCNAFGVDVPDSSAVNVLIGGVFSISSTSGVCAGVTFGGTYSGNSTISGVFNIASNSPSGSPAGVAFNAVASGSTITITSIFTIYSLYTQPRGVSIISTAGGNIDIGSIFTLSCVNGSQQSYGLYLNSATNNISFQTTNLFVLKGNNNCYSSNNDLGTQTNKMNVFGTTTNDSASAGTPDNYRTYTQDANISLIDQSHPVSSTVNFKMSYYSSLLSSDDTRSPMKTALQTYISQSYCPVVGKI
ncbi:hypothetical protein FACS1894166_07330 [Bacilli bacterium]|nr:hypothetical protein FACS1894166_07330 [Bacilli bacterium]